MPQPFPIPVFRESTETNIRNKKLADDDRKYMVRVLATMLTTYVQRPSMNHCAIVASSLLAKFSFLRESVSVYIIMYNFIMCNWISWLLILYRTLGSNSFIQGAKTSIGQIVPPVQNWMLRYQNVLNSKLTMQSMFMLLWISNVMMMKCLSSETLIYWKNKFPSQSQKLPL